MRKYLEEKRHFQICKKNNEKKKEEDLFAKDRYTYVRTYIDIRTYIDTKMTRL